MGLVANSSGPLAEAIDRVIATLLSNVAIEIAHSLDPDLCRADLLPWLAYHRGVDIWFSEWNEGQKRSVVAEATKNFRKRGTLTGLIDALGSLVDEVEIIEWWEEAATTGTFRVNIIGSGINDAGTQNSITDIVKRTSPYTRQGAVTIENAFQVSAQQVVAWRAGLMVNVTSRFPAQRP